MKETYAGIWDGIVVSVDAPSTEPVGAVQVRIPHIHGDVTEVPDTDLPWAEPNFQFAGLGSGIVGVPPENAQVNIIFRYGDKDYPTYIGGSFRTAGAPAAYTAGKQGLTPKTWLWVTPGGFGIIFDELNKKVTLRTSQATLFSLELDETTQKITATTPTGYKLELDEATKKATFQTAAGNSVVLDETVGEATITATAKVILSTLLAEIGVPATQSVLVAELFAPVYDAHTHNVTGVGAPTGPPIPLLTPSLASVISQILKLKN
jgi:hypothetical protein